MSPLRVSAWEKSIRQLRLFFDTWYPWDQRRIASRLRPVTIRKLQESDIEWCERLHLKCERYGVPASNREAFSAYLRSSACLILIVEDSSGRLGTFGIYWYNEIIAYLCYLLVDPGAHRNGVGTTAVISALSMMGTGQREKVLFLSALEGSIPFYRKLGFEVISEDTNSGFLSIHSALREISHLLIQDCADMLLRAGATVPDFSDQIPLARQEASAGAPNA